MFVEAISCGVSHVLIGGGLPCSQSTLSFNNRLCTFYTVTSMWWTCLSFQLLSQLMMHVRDFPFLDFRGSCTVGVLECVQLGSLVHNCLHRSNVHGVYCCRDCIPPSIDPFGSQPWVATTPCFNSWLSPPEGHSKSCRCTNYGPNLLVCQYWLVESKL